MSQITITETIGDLEIIETSAGVFEIGNVIIEFDGSPPLDTSTFDNNLDVSVDTVQKLAQVVDDLVIKEPYQEAMIGTVNGINCIFTTTFDILTNTEQVYINGLLQQPTTHYTITDINEITFTQAPRSNWNLFIIYYKG